LCVCSTQLKNTKENRKTLNQAVKRLTGYMSDIVYVFQVGKHTAIITAVCLIKGSWPGRI